MELKTYYYQKKMRCLTKGFYKGQIKSKYTVSDKHGNGGKSQKGQMWYNDGIRNFKFYPDEAPEGLGKGKLPTKRK